ncbi:MAG: hypothetical protein ABI556_15470 [Gemmatimonadales bacterium]
MKRPSDRIVMEIERHLGQRRKKEKTSVSLSGELIAAIDTIAGNAERSALVERALRSYLRRIIRRNRNEKDLEAINAHADVTNRESDWLLDIQAWPE